MGLIKIVAVYIFLWHAQVQTLHILVRVLGPHPPPVPPAPYLASLSVALACPTPKHAQNGEPIAVVLEEVPLPPAPGAVVAHVVAAHPAQLANVSPPPKERVYGIQELVVEVAAHPVPSFSKLRPAPLA